MEKYFDIAMDAETPASAFIKLRSLKPCFLLESIERGVDQSRYSFLGLGVSNVVQVKNGLFTIDGTVLDSPQTLNEMMNLFRSTLARIPTLRPTISHIPFDGGLVGFSSYDMVRFFEHLPVPKDKEGILSPPDCAYLAPTSLLVFDHEKNSIAVLHSGTEEERLELAANVLSLLQSEAAHLNQSISYSEPAPNIEPEIFYKAVEKAKHHIFEGDIFQIVLSIAFSGECELDPFSVYRAMRLVNPSPYMFFCDIDGFQVVGSSPEALVRLNNNTASLRPIAGTRPRGKNPEDDVANEESLLADDKEIAEHTMLVDLARNDLGRVAQQGTINVNPYQSIERYSHVMHIVSGVQGVLDNNKDAFDLFAAVFPAGTLVGAPKVRAMELIDEIEPSLRGVYGGTVGYFANNGDMDQAIAIRTIVFSKGRYCFQAGAGIVADSVPETEFDEVMAKSEIIRMALRMVKEGV